MSAGGRALGVARRCMHMLDRRRLSRRKLPGVWGQWAEVNAGLQEDVGTLACRGTPPSGTNRPCNRTTCRHAPEASFYIAVRPPGGVEGMGRAVQAEGRNVGC